MTVKIFSSIEKEKELEINITSTYKNYINN